MDPNQTQNPQGVSTPPADDTQVMGTTPPPDAMATPQELGQQTAQNTTPAQSQATPANGAQPTASASQPQAQSPQQNQPQQGTQPGQKQPDLSKVPPGTPATGAAQTPPPNPLAKFANWTKQAAEIMAGGPQYKTTIDPNTGTTTRTPVPVSAAHLGLAIAMEALSGAMTGMAQHGPDSAFKGGELAFQQGEQQQQQSRQMQEQRANNDYARQMSNFETNMRMYATAQSIGRQGYDQNQAYVAQYAPLVNTLQKYQGAIKAVVSYQDLSKYHVTQDNAIPYEVVPRLDPSTGEQVKDSRGVPMWDINYAIVDPSFTAEGLLSPDDVKTLSDHHIQGLTGSDGKPINIPGGFKYRLGLVLNLKAKAAALRVADDTVKNYWDTVKQAGDATGPYTATAPDIKDKNLASLVDTSVQKYAQANGVDPDLLKAVAHGVALRESSGDVNTPDSPVGAIGPMQLMPATAQQYNIDPRNTAQNVDGGVHYLSDLLKRYNGDPKLAMAAYFDGPGRVSATVPGTPKTQAYVNGISQAIGLKRESGADNANYKPVALTKAIDDDQTLPDALMKFNPILAGTGGMVGKAVEQLQAKDPEAAGKINALFGGTDAIRIHDNELAEQIKERQDDEQVRKATETAQAKNDLDRQYSAQMEAVLTPPPNFKFTDDMAGMSQDQLRASLQAQGVATPENYAALYAVGHYDAPTSSAANRVWKKGDPEAMSQQEVISYIRQYINPNFDVAKYDQARTVKLGIANGNSADGKAIRNLGTAVSHLEMLRQAAVALHNNDIPAWNRIANYFGQQTGSPSPTVYKAIAEKVNMEVEKVAAGGTAPYKDSIESGLQNIDSAYGMDTLNQVYNAYIGLMAGRTSSIDDNYFAFTGQHLPNVPHNATTVFQKYGQETPWATQQQPNSSPQGQPQTNPQSQQTANTQQQAAPAFQPPPGSFAGRDKSGQIIAYTLPNGNIVDAKTGAVLRRAGQQNPGQAPPAGPSQSNGIGNLVDQKWTITQ